MTLSGQTGRPRRPGSRGLFAGFKTPEGYEFEILIIVNCCKHVLPALDVPAEEAFCDICKLYVAMTRAKRELILSFHETASSWINAVSSSIALDYWSSCEIMNDALRHADAIHRVNRGS